MQPLFWSYRENDNIWDLLKPTRMTTSHIPVHALRTTGAVMSKKCDVVFQDMHQAFLWTGENTSLTVT